MDANLYSRNQRYGKLWFQYSRMRRLLEKLGRYGYIEKKRGFKDKYGRQTRIWATVKLIRVFVDEYKFRPIGDIHYTQPENLIQLRNEYKKKNSKNKTVKVSEDVEFEPTESTELMQANLQQLNNLARAKKITVRLDEVDEINLEELTVNILSDLIKGKIELQEAELIGCGNDKGSSTGTGTHYHRTIRSASDTQDTTDTSTAMDKLDIEVLTHKNYSYPVALYRSFIDADLNRTALLSTITHTLKSPQYQGLQPESALFLHLLWMKKLLSLMNARAKKEEFIKQDRPLIDFGIKKLVFEIKVKDMHRVFNRGSKEFDKGGRFYGPYYQGMPSKFRKNLYIDGKKTVEWDYSGLHIRMLYHQLGLEFNEDPYAIGDGSQRNEYKLVSLISINAQKRGSHIAVRDALEDAGFDLEQQDLTQVCKMMDDFKARHAPIKEFLFSGVGIDLQNADSRIMENVMMLLHKAGIPALPIHDSVIVQEEHSARLQKIMVRVYEEEMGHTPVLKLAG
ncbi:hypothetical protein [uncultured Desulfobacter sp.]|uniref:hypothetical protein n=1 Tax=uncultured Desulfobacter sp. TaxID=240139 RepID=UPI0029C6B866|nr:hypothetical protein [uncultured Desulfobacter sp.]